MTYEMEKEVLSRKKNCLDNQHSSGNYEIIM